MSQLRPYAGLRGIVAIFDGYGGVYGDSFFNDIANQV